MLKDKLRLFSFACALIRLHMVSARILSKNSCPAQVRSNGTTEITLSLVLDLTGSQFKRPASYSRLQWYLIRGSSYPSIGGTFTWPESGFSSKYKSNFLT